MFEAVAAHGHGLSELKSAEDSVYAQQRASSCHPSPIGCFRNAAAAGEHCVQRYQEATCDRLSAWSGGPLIQTRITAWLCSSTARSDSLHIKTSLSAMAWAFQQACHGICMRHGIPLSMHFRTKESETRSAIICQGGFGLAGIGFCMEPQEGDGGLRIPYEMNHGCRA